MTTSPGASMILTTDTVATMTIMATLSGATMRLREMWSPAFAQHSRRCADIAAAENAAEALATREKHDSSTENASASYRPVSTRV